MRGRASPQDNVQCLEVIYQLRGFGTLSRPFTYACGYPSFRAVTHVRNDDVDRPENATVRTVGCALVRARARRSMALGFGWLERRILILQT